ncbi:SDR family NAD(P)-dependent oxidoreductase [Sandaracinus amylolyticus]|uniref:SDR family NAD(P)-dependent oxidoreductase n=1 Tax=Sandaracinus amylolyticus TaxID=927083 RepID=UPI001F1B07F1|nr:SDR family NAD(P)-dependent oxidoreductase [Sandaracinus amylolyticus]UJR83662.1 Hypothetical protein I5071_57310 [Sandaracinus amylolyticus]
MTSRTAVITGAGAGLGRAIALELVSRGYDVRGTSRSDEETESLAAASGARAVLTPCDITKDDDVARFAKEASFGDRGVDVLVSNVGILTPGPLELLSIEQVRHEFEVDVFGALRVVQAFLPALRRARGRIVQVSSWSARFPLPFSGPSSACKAALEALADAYRGELAQQGVDFITVLPGNMRTDAPAKSAAAIQRMRDAMTEEQRALYGSAFASFERAFNAAQGSGMDPAVAASLIVDRAEENPSPIRAPIGVEAAKVLRMVRERSDAELDHARLQFLGLAPGRPF